MNVKELREALALMPDDMRVIIAKGSSVACQWHDVASFDGAPSQHGLIIIAKEYDQRKART